MGFVGVGVISIIWLKTETTTRQAGGIWQIGVEKETG
jgi:hypothetical protein